MDARRQLIRYAITGGYALMIAAFYEAVFGWAWKESVEGLIPISRADAFTTIGGAVAVGFVLYQLYSALDRPGARLHLTLQAPRWLTGRFAPLSRAWTFQVPLFGERDVSGEILDALHAIPSVERALEHAYGRRAAGARVGQGQAKARDRHDEDANVLNSVLNLTYCSGDGQIARSYAALEDSYHALGACDAALVAISIAAAVYVVATHSHAYAAHIAPSIAVTVLALLLIWGSHRVIRVNRQRRWSTMTHQLRNDLRAWALRHPHLLSQLAEEMPVE
jgi:hypothetical protein